MLVQVREWAKKQLSFRQEQAELTPKEAERLQRLRRRAYHLQNNIDSRPNYNMHHSKAELSALCWAIEKISGVPFDAKGGLRD